MITKNLIWYLLIFPMFCCSSISKDDVKTNDQNSDDSFLQLECELLTMFDELCFAQEESQKAKLDLIRVIVRRRELSTILFNIEKKGTSIVTTTKIIEPNRFSLFSIQNINPKVNYECTRDFNTSINYDLLLKEVTSLDSEKKPINNDVVYDSYLIEVISNDRYIRKRIFNEPKAESTKYLTSVLDQLLDAEK